MTNEDIISKINGGLANIGGVDNSVKIVFGDEGQILVSGSEAIESDADADCTITLTKDDLMSLAKGELDPMGAFMSGKLKIGGDMSVALGLQKLFKSM